MNTLLRAVIKIILILVSVTVFDKFPFSVFGFFDNFWISFLWKVFRIM